MVDVVDKATRSRMMAGIQAKNTKPEVLVRSFLHAQGFRFRIHAKNLPGTPDLVLPCWRTVIFVHGCFWHWHDCRYFKLPQTRIDFWREKLASNRTRDEENRQRLEELGWQILVVHECELRDALETTLAKLVTSVCKLYGSLPVLTKS